MSRDDSRARSVGPLAQIVPSATAPSEIDGFFSCESSTSTWVCSASCFCSFASLLSAYERSAGVTSTFLPLTSSLIDASLVVIRSKVELNEPCTSRGLPELDAIAVGIGNPAESTDTLHLLRFLGHARALGAQLREHRVQVANPEVEHRLLSARPEVVGLGLERREHRRAGCLVPQAVLIGVQSQAIAVPRAQCLRIPGPHEVTADSKHTLDAAILPGRLRCDSCCGNAGRPLKHGLGGGPLDPDSLLGRVRAEDAPSFFAILSGALISVSVEVAGVRDRCPSRLTTDRRRNARMRIRVLLALTAAVLAGLVATVSASAAHQNGLVNVAVVDNTVQIPIGVAANVCGVAV